MSEFKISVHDLFSFFPLIKKKLSVHTHFLKTEQLCSSFNLEWWDLPDCLNAGAWACNRSDRVICDTETMLLCQGDQRSVSFWATRLSGEVGQQVRDEARASPPAHYPPTQGD